MMNTRLRFTALAVLATSLVPAAAFAQQPTEAPPPVAPPTIGNGEAPPPAPPPPPPPVIVTPDAPPPPPPPPPLPTTPPEPLPPGPGPASPSDAENPGVTNPFTSTPGAKGLGRGAFYFHVEPFVGIVGGAKLDNPIQQPSQNRDTRVSAIMLADFGVRGELSDWISFESELMANGGTGLRGTSVYDGEASLQVRKQAIHLGKNKWMIEAGRVVDEASVDYFSLHIADTFMQDTATRNALLFSGYNLGNGIRGTYEIIEGLRVGLAANAGNPTSSSSVLAIGGTFPPYDRIYFQAAQKTRQDLNGYPDDQFHAYVLTPSVLFNHKYFEARTAAQMFMIDPNANDEVSQNIRGYNIRANGRLHLLDDMISPYGNFSIDRNDVVDPNNATKLSADKYTGLSYGGGVDFNYMKRFGNWNGIGAQYMQTEQKTSNSNVTTNRYLNIGSTFWLHRNVAVGARFALWATELKNVNTTGERSVIATLRLVL